MQPNHDKTERLRLSIAGMTCTGCERRIEAAAAELAGVRSAKAVYGSASLELEFDPAVTDRQTLSADVATALTGLGYSLAGSAAPEDGGRRRTAGDSFGALQLAGIAVVLLAAFVLLQRSGLLSRIPEIGPSLGYGVLFLVGLLTSLHCVGMCGGITLSVSVRSDSATEGTVFSRLRPGLLYNSGRVIAYTLIGGLAGALGSVISFSGTARGWLVAAVGLFMLLMGLNMLGLFPWLRRITPRLPAGLGRKLVGASGSRGPFVVGLLNGFMPCGPLQSVQLYALGTGSFLAGATSMFLFSVGTVPLMFGLGALGSLLTGRFARRMVQVSALVVMFLGVAMVGRGLNLTGSRLALLPSVVMSRFAGLLGAGVPARAGGPSAPARVARIEDGVQLVQIDISSSAYQPIIVQRGVPVRWTIRADASALNGCNNPVTIPEYDVVRRLAPGTNVIEFTPDKAGNVLYTCWMGMISSTIRVVDDLAAVTDQDLQEAARYAATAPSTGSGGCCGPGGTGGVVDGPIALSTDYRISTAGVALARIEGEVQRVSLQLDGEGYSPAVLVVQRGVPVEWTLQGAEITEDNYRMVVRAYQARVELGAGENVITFTPSFDFTFDSWTDTIHGYVKVVEDLRRVDVGEVRRQVEAFAAGIRETAARAEAESTAPAAGTGGGGDGSL